MRYDRQASTIHKSHMQLDGEPRVGGANRRDARAHGLSIDEHGARAALREAAAIFRAVQLQIIAQHIKERGVVGHRNLLGAAIDL